MKPSDLTICIPTYNGTRWIGETLRTAASLPFPILVSDDASTDATPDLIEREFGDRVHLHRHETNGGLGWNFSYVLEACETTWILILNQDDLLDPAAFTRVRARNDEVTVLNGWYIDGTGTRKRLIYRRPPARAFLLGVYAAMEHVNFVKTTAQAILPVAVVRELGGFRIPGDAEQGAEDWFCYLRLASAGITFRLSMRPAMSHRVHSDSYSISRPVTMGRSEHGIRQAMPTRPRRDKRLRVRW